MQVEVANVKRGELGAGEREDDVENELGKFKGCCRGADITGKGDAISSNGDARAVGIALLRADLGISSKLMRKKVLVPLTCLPVPSGEVPIPR